MAAAAGQAPRCMRQRSLRVLVTPTPVTFAERRSVLQVLEQHGPVEVFKMTPGYYGNFMSVTRNSATAARIVACSPLVYTVAVPRGSSDEALDDPERPPAPLDANPPSLEGPGPGQQHRTFRLDVFPEPDYEHRHAMLSSPLQHPWPSAYEHDRSFMAAILKQTLPRTIAAKGLAHWFLDLGQAPRMSGSRRVELKRWLPSRMKA